MEFGIPISRFDINHLRWGLPRLGPFRRTIPFSYEENQTHLHSLIVCLHPLRVVEVDFLKIQILLEETRRLSFLTKLEQFQNCVSQSLQKYLDSWTEGCTRMIEGSIPLQPLVKNKKLTLYLSSQPESLTFIEDGETAVFSETTVKPGDLLRITVKFQGLSLQMIEDNVWTGKSRIQHHILQIYKVKPDPTE